MSEGSGAEANCGHLASRPQASTTCFQQRLSITAHARKLHSAPALRRRGARTTKTLHCARPAAHRCASHYSANPPCSRFIVPPFPFPHPAVLTPILGTPSSSRTGTCCRHPPRSFPTEACKLPVTAFTEITKRYC